MSMVLRRATVRGLVLVLALAAMALWGPVGHAAAASGAASPYPPVPACTVSINNGTITPGEQTTIVGSGFPANRVVTLSIGSHELAEVRTDRSGSFQYVFVPTSADSGKTITADSASQTCSFAMGIEPIQTHRATPPTPNPAPLASTGFATMSAAIIAFLLVSGGALLMVAGRRRSKTH